MTGLHPLMLLAALASPSADGFVRNTLHLLRYASAAVDLDGDGKPEWLVHADGPEHCGSGGCDLYVLAPTATGYRIVSDISVARRPIRVLATRSHGWRDLGVTVAGGGIRHGYEARLRFDGTSYPTNPTVAPAQPLAHTRGRIVLR